MNARVAKPWYRRAVRLTASPALVAEAATIWLARERNERPEADYIRGAMQSRGDSV